MSEKDFDYEGNQAGDDVDICLLFENGDEIPLYTCTDFSYELAQKKEVRPPMGSKGKHRRVRFKKTWQGSLKIEEVHRFLLEREEDLAIGRTPNNDEFTVGGQVITDLCDLRNMVLRQTMPDGRVRRWYDVEFDKVGGSSALDSVVGMDLDWTATSAKGIF